MIPGIFVNDRPPEQLYPKCPAAFWAIVSVGARKYQQDPHLLDFIGSRIVDLAVSSIYSMTNATPAIAAVLLLCLWPIPINTTYKDPSHALAGAAMQLALQNGLHIWGHEEDFYRDQESCAYEGEVFRARLWAQCTVTVQNTSLCDGLPAWSVPEACPMEQKYSISPNRNWLYHYQLHRIQMSAISSIARNLELAGSKDESSFDGFINVFDAQIIATVVEEYKTCNILVQRCAQLSIRAFHFFQEDSTLKRPGIIQVYAISCQLIDLYEQLDVSEEWASYAPRYFARMMYLAAYCILRITKSEIRGCIDLKGGEEAFFKAVSLAKRRSIKVNDLDWRNAMILNQLWMSPRAFRKKDGTLNGLSLHLRSRLVSSLSNTSTSLRN
jgi:transcriptional regulatory protein LEU3